MVFLTPLVLRPLSHRLWQLQANFVVESDVAGQVFVPAGFVCDLSSMPRALWWESTPTDYAEAGVLHDYAYHDHRLPRDTADALYRETLLALGMGRWRAAVRYRALRLFGSVAYRHDAPQESDTASGKPSE